MNIDREGLIDALKEAAESLDLNKARLPLYDELYGYAGMLAAAPTLPAPVVVTHQYTGKPRHPSDIESDPEGILMLGPNETLLAAPMTTPPAQDEEPDVWKCVRNCSTNYLYDAVSASIAAKNGWTVTPLYTRPDTSELRHAAEEMIEKISWMRNFLSYGHTQDIVKRELTEAGENLRAALGRK